MARKPTLTQQTNAHTHATLSAELATLAQASDPFAERRYAVLVDGLPLGQRPNEIRKPGSSFYFQPFLEANSVAQLAVTLDFDRAGVVEVHRRSPPQPDIELTINGETVAFVEQTMVMDQGAHRLELDIDELNDSILKCDESIVRGKLCAGTLTVRLNKIPVEYYDTRLPIDKLVQETYALIRSLSGGTKMKVDGAQYPLLGKMEAWAGYQLPGNTENAVMSVDKPGRPNALLSALTEQIRKKKSRVTAARYPLECRPLWLLLDIDLHFGSHIDLVRALPIIATENPIEFDRIIVQQPRGKLLNVDLRRP